MPYSDHNITRTSRWVVSSFLWQIGQGWIKQPDQIVTPQTVNDRVYVGTKRPLPKGFKPPSAYHRVTVRTFVNPSAWFQEWYANGTPYQYRSGAIDLHVVSSLSRPPAVPVGVRNAMQFDALQKIKNQKMDLGVSIIELPKTARLVGQTATSIARSIMSARRGKWEDAAGHIGLDGSMFRDVSKRWLTLQYGWTPLMMDVESACSVLTDGLGNMRYGVTVTRRYPIEQPVAPANHSVRRTGDRRLKLRLDFKLDNSKAQSYAQLGLTNPASIAWELVPFSFVADWFVPIGDWINALDIGMYADFLGGSFTDFYDYTDDHSSMRNTIGGTVREVGVYGHRMKTVSIERSVISSYLPKVFSPPDFSLSLKQMASGLSLLQEVVVRGRR